MTAQLIDMGLKYTGKTNVCFNWSFLDVVFADDLYATLYVTVISTSIVDVCCLEEARKKYLQ